MRIYKIIKTIEKSLKTNHLNDCDFTDSYIEETTWYKAKRKGKFGFWHTVEYKNNKFNIMLPVISKNIESVKKYITNYHLYHYGNEEFKIIEE